VTEKQLATQFNKVDRAIKHCVLQLTLGSDQKRADSGVAEVSGMQPDHFWR